MADHGENENLERRVAEQEAQRAKEAEARLTALEYVVGALVMQPDIDREAIRRQLDGVTGRPRHFIAVLLGEGK